MKTGVGFSDSHDTPTAATEAARAAMDAAGLKAGEPALVLLFTTARHDHHAIGPAIAAIVGPQAKLIGGHGVGIITREHLGYDGWQIGVAVLAGPELSFDIVTESGLPEGENAVGKKLAHALGSLSSSDSHLLFYDSIRYVDGKPRLNMVSPLIDGLEAELKSGAAEPFTWPAFAGMGLLGDMQFSPGWQWVGPTEPVQQSAMILRLRAPLQIQTTIMHGCRPAGRYYTITKAEGPVVLEIDNKPALDAIGEMLGPEAGLSWDDYALFVTLGVNRGDPYGPFVEDNYANRMCISVDADRKGLIMFEDDLHAGMKVQLMRRSMDFAYIGQRTQALLDTIAAAGRKPLLAYYIDCIGRAAAYCGMDEEEATEVQKALPPGLPLLGVYSGVEVAKVAGRPQALDWTGVLCILSI